MRPDGTSATLDLARRGVLPHEAFHFVVESTLGWHDGFFGHVARGDSLDQITTKLHGAHAEWTKLIQGRQAEALIECLETEQVRGADDPATFAARLVDTCRRRGVPPPDIMADELETVRRALRDFGAAW